MKIDKLISATNEMTDNFPVDEIQVILKDGDILEIDNVYYNHLTGTVLISAVNPDEDEDDEENNFGDYDEE